MRASSCWVLIAASAAGFAQPGYGCHASPELEKFYAGIKDSWNRAEALRARLEDEPDNFFLHRWYLESPQIRTGSLHEQYRSLLEKHPEDASYVYLYGRALMGANTRKAIEYLNRSIEEDPQSPWGYFSLIRVYGSPNFKSPAKLGENLLAFTERCPENLEIFRNLRLVEDKQQLHELTARLRGLLESRGSSDMGAYYSILWGAEFRGAETDQFESLRAKVAEDMKRLKKLDPPNHAALAQGYKLIGDHAAAEASLKLARTNPNPRGFLDDFNSWSKEHPYPKRDGTAEEKERFYQERLRASRQWLKDWPDNPQSQYWYFASLSAVKDSRPDELERAGERLLQMAARQPNTWSPYPQSLSVAQEWNRHDLRLRDCIRLAGQAIAEMDRGPGEDNDMFRGSQSESLRSMASNLAMSRFSAYAVQSEASRKLNDFAGARKVVDAMKDWLDKNPGDYPRLQWSHMVQRARLEEAEGHNADALGYYQRAVHLYDDDPEIRGRARALWQKQGGSLEAFEVWARRDATRPAIASAENVSWHELHKPIGAFNVRDLSGRTWTIAELKGKTTLVNVWATWCGPCVAELPQLQALFDLAKDRKEIQVITINVDENPGLVAGFMEKNHFGFPVLFARSLADELMPSFSIPRNWIVDRDGNLRQESIGFNSRLADWPRQTLDRLMQPMK